MKKDIVVTAEVMFTVEADKDNEQGYNEHIEVIVASTGEFLSNVLDLDADIEIISEEGTEELFLTKDVDTDSL